MCENKMLMGISGPKKEEIREGRRQLYNGEEVRNACGWETSRE
jgi:hypothetical protein